MPTIDHSDGGQTFVNVTSDGLVRVEHDHLVKPTDDLDPAAARARASAHRAVADALDAAADHILSTRVSETFARLERLIESHDRLGDAEEIAHATATVRALLDGTEPPALPTPALEEAPVIT